MAPAIIAFLLVLTTGLPTAAAGAGGATWTPARARTVLVPSGFRTMRSSVYAMVTLRWSPATLQGLQGYADTGLAFTLEVNDLTGRLSGTGFWMSDLPGAAYDRDDDDGDGRWEEVEITAADTAAIVARRPYRVGLQLSRWYRPCAERGCRWRWEHRPGRVATLGQLSAWFFGEWQAQRWTAPWSVQVVPRMPRPVVTGVDGGVAGANGRSAGPGVVSGPVADPGSAPDPGSTVAATVRVVGRWHGRAAVCGGPAWVADPVAVCRRLGLHHATMPARTVEAERSPIRGRGAAERVDGWRWAARIR